MNLVSLQTLRDQSRARADMQNSGFVEDAELDRYINSSLKEFYDLVVTKFEDQYTNPVPYPITAPAPTPPAVQTAVDLPTDFFKLRGVDIQVAGDQWTTATEYTFQERNRLQNPWLFTNTNQQTYQYRLFGSKIFFFGLQNGPVTAQLWYIPTCPTLVAADDTFDFVNGWEEYVIVDVARKLRSKEESDTTLLEREKLALIERINNTANNRNAGEPDRVTDISTLGYGPFQRF